MTGNDCHLKRCLHGLVLYNINKNIVASIKSNCYNDI